VSPAAGFSLYQFFAPGGLLSKTHPAYEFRRGQLQMAQAVEEALEEKRHLIVEAGTGTGKTLAYLLPVIRSGKRVIISTGTKNLQEQLFFKDVPALERALFPEGDRKLSVCYMKGRNNYLCRKKLFDLTDQPVLSGLEEIEHYRAIAAWEKTTQTGDRAELAELPEASALWHKLDARADTCLGQKCKEYDRCFITEMRRRAAESDIIIVNHHLFFADLSIKLEAEGAPDAGVLPECGAVIFDEAHTLEAVSRAVDALLAVLWSAFRDELRNPDPDQVSELAQRLALIGELVRCAALRRHSAGGDTQPLPTIVSSGPRGAPPPRDEETRPRSTSQPRAVHGSVLDGARRRGPEPAGFSDALWVGALKEEIEHSQHSSSPLSLLVTELADADRVSAVETPAEAATTFGWGDVVGEHGDSIGLDRFGASAPAGDLFETFGFTAENVYRRARALLDD